MVDIRHVQKQYTASTTRGWFRTEKRSVCGLRDVSFTISRGELFGLLGRNGAGKTTLIKCMTGLLLPSSGEIHIQGQDVATHPRRVAALTGCVVVGERGLYWKLTGRENLDYFATLYFVPRARRAAIIARLIDRLQLADFVDRAVESYSSGQRVKIAFARALLHDPPLLVLDEPTNALDAHAARDIRTLIAELHREGKTIVFSTHLLDEAEELCDRVAIIDGGALVALDSPTALIAQLPTDHHVELVVSGTPVGALCLPPLPGLRVDVLVNDGTARGEHQLRVTCADPGHALSVLLPRLDKLRLRVVHVATRQRTLEDFFLARTNYYTSAVEEESPRIPARARDAKV